jgi:hypothetical protein
MHFLKVKCNQKLNLEQQTTASEKKEWFYAHKRRRLSFMTIFGSVQKQRSRKTKC